MNKKIVYIVNIILFLITCFIGTYMTFNKKYQNKCNNEDILNIVKYEIQTHEYFEKKPKETKYFINSVEELKSFYKIYSDTINIEESILNNNSFFIQVEEASSGSINMKLSSVTIENNKIKFIIDKNIPEIGTDDMAFWYFIAIVPNENIKDINISEWIKPSTLDFSNF